MTKTIATKQFFAKFRDDEICLVRLFTTTRHGVSAKELERPLGVTYKPASRMATLIREHIRG